MRTSSRLRPLLRQLPFPLDDTDRLNHVYARWARSGALSDREIVDLWTYCFTWRYFLSKAARSSMRRPSDMDALIARSIRRTCRTRHDATAIVRYASWVSVVCRNTFVNYAKRSRALASIDDLRGFAVSEPAPTYNDAPRIRRVLLAAILRLPTYLQDTARLFFVDGCSFETIAASTGKSIPTVRTYKCRALNELRRDPDLRKISEGFAPPA
ncbi:RNA polymerase subunit sigma-70 [Longibacter salinarum]|uniref:RNA polymerase subunit sigma-70 n=1 Tax=Longibacter salinarum TaxID=1850348 RepID=A0A2A8CV70_9BACT|nr:sigma-70 family RNA polymerase sigma factor [Longibacter salinarum]PEN12546.1 RNA polymerase subunit sigma-70 [Longibacter salinarum]